MLSITSQGLSSTTNSTFSAFDERETLDQNFAAELSSALLTNPVISAIEPTDITNTVNATTNKIQIGQTALLISVNKNTDTIDEVDSLCIQEKIETSLPQKNGHTESQLTPDTHMRKSLSSARELSEVINGEGVKGETIPIESSSTDWGIEKLKSESTEVKSPTDLIKSATVAEQKESSESLIPSPTSTHNNAVIKNEEPPVQATVVKNDNTPLINQELVDDRKFEKVEGGEIVSTVSLYQIGENAEQLDATSQFFKLTEDASTADKAIIPSIKITPAETQSSEMAAPKITNQSRSKFSSQNLKVEMRSLESIMKPTSMPPVEAIPASVLEPRAPSSIQQNQPLEVEIDTPVIEWESSVVNATGAPTSIPISLVGQQHNAPVEQQLETHVLEQVKYQVNKAITQDQQLIKFKLMPEDLGEIEIHFETNLTTGHTNISLFTERYNTLDIIAKIGDQIQASFIDNGFESGNFSLNFGMQDRGNQEDKNSKSESTSAESKLKPTTLREANTFYMGIGAEAINILV